MLRRLGFGLVSSLTALAFLHGACGGAIQSGLFDEGGSGGDVTSNDGPSDSTMGGDTTPSDGPVNGDSGDAGDAADSSPCLAHCSADLHQVLDCNDNVLQTCTATEGCDPKGTCVPACQSAIANQSHVGCDFYAVDPDIILNSGYEGSCYAAFVVNTWTAPVTISVDRAGQTFNTTDFARIPQGSGMSLTYGSLPNGQLPPGQVAILFLSGVPTAKALCPLGITPAMTTDAAVHGTALGTAFHVNASAPLVMYDMLPYGAGTADISGASLLYPTAAWGTNYVVMDAYPMGTGGGVGDNLLPSTNVVALADNTKVTIKPVTAILAGGGVAGAQQGSPTTYTLSKGQVLQVTQNLELTGSPIQSDKPVGVWGGHGCADIPTSACCCDDAHQQLPPVGSVGNEYVAVHYRDRDMNMPETPPWRVVGMVDATALTYDPAPPAGAPSTLMLGQVAEFDSGTPFVVSSQDAKHPFLMSAHMTGGQQYNGSGDPEFVQVVPPAQYLRDYVFFTDPTFPETNLVVVRAQSGGAFKDVTLDCAGKLTGWQPVGNGGKYQYTLIDLSRHDFQAQGACNNGRQESTSDGPFEVTVWGWGTTETQMPTTYVSYAYPAGAGVATLNSVVVSAQ
jgi:hypothetical protein